MPSKMDRLVLEWILRHALKHSYSSVINKIHTDCPEIKYEPYLEKFVLYATFSKLCTMKRRLHLEHRKMLWHALKKFISSPQEQGVSDAILRPCLQMILILKWIIFIETSLTKHHGPISSMPLANLIARKKTFEKKWKSLTERSSIPCKEIAHDMELKLTDKCSSATDVCMKLIEEMSVYIISILNSCLDKMKSSLPSTAIEEMQSKEIDYCLEETKVLPYDPLERLSCLSAMIKKDPSEKGLVSLVKLILVKSPAGLLVNGGSESINSSQTLGEMTRDGSKTVEMYMDRLHQYRKLFVALQSLCQRKSQSCDHETAVSPELGENAVAVGKIGYHSKRVKALNSQDEVQFGSGVSPKGRNSRRDKDTSGSGNTPKKKVAGGEESSGRPLEGSDEQITAVGSVGNEPRASPRRCYNTRQQKVKERDDRSKIGHTKECGTSPNTSPALKVSPRSEKRKGCSVLKSEAKKNLAQGPLLKDMEDGCEVIELSVSEIQFPCSIEWSIENSGIGDGTVGGDVGKREIAAKTVDPVSWGEVEEKCSVSSLTEDSLELSCSSYSSTSDSKMNITVQKLDVDLPRAKRSAESDAKGDKRFRRKLGKEVKPISDAKNDGALETHEVDIPRVTRNTAVRSLFSEKEAEIFRVVTPEYEDEGCIFTTLSHNELYYSCSSGVDSQEKNS